MPETLFLYGFYAAVCLIPAVVYLRWQRSHEDAAREASGKAALFGEGPRAQHPHIDVSNCIGCQGCATACPEGGVLGMIGGKAAVIRPHSCIGHGLCADACPVGAIRMTNASPGFSADLPHLSPQYETSVSNLFIAGELGGLALIRNAVQQGRDCIDAVAARLERNALPAGGEGIYDVVIVGAGPAGISASLRATEHRLHYLTIERETVGGAVGKYPRQKLIMTAPIHFPLYGTLKQKEMSKENLMDFWKTVTGREDFRVRLNEPVENIQKDRDGCFTVFTRHGLYRARAVVLSLGRAGNPRKLGVAGEQLPKVMYRLLDAEHYTHQNILVVGGGDSAVEAALGLARQKGNQVTISYRRDSFERIKERNANHLQEALRSGSLRVLYRSVPVEFRDRSVLLDVAGVRQELANDYVWIFAGGVAPNDFLKKIGVAFGARDLIAEAQPSSSC